MNIDEALETLRKFVDQRRCGSECNFCSDVRAAFGFVREELEELNHIAEQATRRGMEAEAALREVRDLLDFVVRADGTPDHTKLGLAWGVANDALSTPPNQEPQRPPLFPGDRAMLRNLAAKTASSGGERSTQEANQCLICEHPADHDQRLCVAQLERYEEALREAANDADLLRKSLRIALSDGQVKHAAAALSTPAQA